MLNSKSCLIIAGEKSGEEHAMSFFPELKALSPDTQFFGVGGEDLEKEGVELLYHLKDFSSMGFSEVIGKIPFYKEALKRIENEVVARKTKTAILIDFQGFNMRIAKRLSKLGVKVLYYVAPQAWAWKAHRAKALSESTHTLFTILPFEKDWFMSRGVKQVKAIPHPLMLHFKDELNNIPPRPFGCWDEKIKILLLPGSRKFEVTSLLPKFIETIELLKKDYKVEVHLARVGHLDPSLYDYFSDKVDVWYEDRQITEALKTAHFTLAASGTVTLSCGLFEMPTIVSYKGSLLNEFIFRNFIKYSGHISLTNIVHEQEIFPELIQEQVDPAKMYGILKSWIENKDVYQQKKNLLKMTKNLLSGDDFSVPEYMSQVINEQE
ncbi:MAG: lipid-A-disaccharide synthase [Bacteriovoracaceae bacterium]